MPFGVSLGWPYESSWKPAQKQKRPRELTCAGPTVLLQKTCPGEIKTDSVCHGNSLEPPRSELSLKPWPIQAETTFKASLASRVGHLRLAKLPARSQGMWPAPWCFGCVTGGWNAVMCGSRWKMWPRGWWYHSRGASTGPQLVGRGWRLKVVVFGTQQQVVRCGQRLELSGQVVYRY